MKKILLILIFAAFLLPVLDFAGATKRAPFSGVSVSLRVYLQGALMHNGGSVGSTGWPLMRDNLRVSPFNGQNNIPLQDPYKYPTAFIDVTSKYDHVPETQGEIYHVISDPAILSVSGENAIVDWVFVELRSALDSTLVVATRSGLIQRDGDVVDLDGVSPLFFPNSLSSDYFVSVRHRSHLGVMSQKRPVDVMIDFTSPATETFYTNGAPYGISFEGLSQNAFVINGYRALWAGDFNGDGLIKTTNPNDDLGVLFYDVIMHPSNPNMHASFDNAVGYFNSDYNMNGKAKYTNPNDDTNLLFGQVFFYPINITFQFNFSILMEQLPK